MVWWSSEHSTGIQLDYPSILLHAIARDTTHFPHPALYLQLETGAPGTWTRGEMNPVET